MKNKQKGSIHISLIIFLVLSIAGFSIYKYIKEPGSEKPNTNLTQPNNERVTTEKNTTETVQNDEQIKENTAIKETEPKPLPSKNGTINNIANNAAIRSVMGSFKPIAELIFSEKNSYMSLCKNGIVNIDAHQNVQLGINQILKAQRVQNQTEANIKCVASNDSYAIDILFNEQSTSNGWDSYCVSTNNKSISGDTNSRIDPLALNCKFK